MPRNKDKNGNLIHISDSFPYDRSFTGCFDKSDFTFDDVSTIGHFRLSLKSPILK